MLKKRGRKVLLVSLAVMMILPAFSFTAFAEGATPPIDGSGYIIMKVDSKYMNVNGETVEVDPGRDTAPIIVDNRTMIPARALTEAMGGTADWDPSTQNVTLFAYGNTAIMTLNQNEYSINGYSDVMDVAPILLNSRTLIPLRFAGEALGCQVQWFEETREILVTFTLSTKQQYSDGLDENGFWEGIKALDYVDISGYKAMKFPRDVHQIPDDILQSEIANIMANFSTTVKTMTRAVKKGDTVNIDYVGSINGVEFSGGSTNGAGTDVIIGETQYIDGFLDQLIGHKPGEKVRVNVTFPKDYGEATLQGKAALFVTTINYITETVVPELTDAFVSENLTAYYGWTNVKEMKDYMSSSLQKYAIEKFIEEYFIKEIIIKSVPEQLLKYQERYMLSSLRELAAYYGIGLIEMINYEGISGIEELIDTFYETNYNQAVYYLVIQAIAEDAGISVDTKDIEAYFLDKYGSTDYSAYVDEYGLPYTKQTVLSQKVLDYVIRNTVRL